MVRPAGFEPTTPWFEAKYSNPLSYGRTGNETKLRFFLIAPGKKCHFCSGCSFSLISDSASILAKVFPSKFCSIIVTSLARILG